MNWKCDVVTDLAPLYHDGVASKASRKLVREHLKECPECRAYYKKYAPVEGIKMDMPISDAEDFVLLAKQMRKRRLLLWGGFLSYVSATLVALVLYWAKKNR
ncbi:MAG: zf-HC2 domain-containing protein [Anaerotignum sp.]|nr:zf-HC2 domain-containing protein [Anaerotignum sp.]